MPTRPPLPPQGGCAGKLYVFMLLPASLPVTLGRKAMPSDHDVPWNSLLSSEGPGTLAIGRPGANCH